MMKPKEIRKGVWEFKEDGMNVPGRIYATPNIMEGIEEGVLRQVSNVAKLPGIQRASFAMPDAHYGYGFCIGGVAAFDLEEGVISPGGVGYDINCLPAKTQVLMSDGSPENIGNVELGDKVLVYDYEKERLKTSRVLLTLSRMDDIFEILTSHGHRIEATKDHPFLTPWGMVPMKSIALGGEIALYFEDLMWDTVKSIRLKKRDVDVYDFTVKNKHHNFIADSFVVSNCGVRLLTTDLNIEDVRSNLKPLIDKLFRNIPSGVGSKGKLRISESELDDVAINGAKWATDHGLGEKEDLKHIEENGCIEGADPKKIGKRAKQRGLPQLGTLGSGNHFLEVQKVDQIFNNTVAKKFGIAEGDVTLMIHCGSRGFGYQVADDYIKIMLGASQKYNIPLPDRQLACAPINSVEAENYVKAMYCAVNYAFCNREVITQWVRETIYNIFGDCEVNLLYDVCHNIAKFEEHEIDGKMRKVCVHRKGATRAFPAGRKEIPAIYRDTGQPVLIPGDMGTASYVLIGTERAMEETFGSTCHGAGRVMSRSGAKRKFSGEEVKRRLEQRGEVIRATSPKVLAEEVPEAYKDIDEVIKSVELSGLSEKVARLIPLGVVKG